MRTSGRCCFSIAKQGLRELVSLYAVMVRIAPGNADKIEIKLVQLKAGSSDLTGGEIRRLKNAIDDVSKEWVLAAFDGQKIYFATDEASAKKVKAARA